MNKEKLVLKELAPAETGQLLPCLEALDAYHNAVSVHFSGSYPARENSVKLAEFKQSLEDGTSKIAGVFQESDLLGFCKIDLFASYGKLDYLVVLPRARGRGLGDKLMQWALAEFARYGLEQIEVKVVYGNDAVAFYEKYGFQLNAQILVTKRGASHK
ncbi:MAG: GNAT family N-acetyltransferase [Phascolarctobacterium sp.]